MPAEIISGKDVAAGIRGEVWQRVAELGQQADIVPGLATVLVGADPASVSYVTAKGKACEELGMKSLQYTLPAETSEEELLRLVEDLNRNPEVHGILVQLPFPKHITASK